MEDGHEKNDAAGCVPHASGEAARPHGTPDVRVVVCGRCHRALLQTSGRRRTRYCTTACRLAATRERRAAARAYVIESMADPQAISADVARALKVLGLNPDYARSRSSAG